MTPEATLKTCFVIAPIGEEGSSTRVHSDNVLKFIIEPTVSDCGYTAIRADKISEPGIITNQIIQHILEDALVIADLTDGNPCVFYELALRHVARKPFVQIAKSQGPLPFDVAPARTILFLDTNSSSVDRCKQELARQIKAAEQNLGNVDSPLSIGIDILQFRKSGNLGEKSNAEILSMLQDLRGEFVRTLREQSERISELQSLLTINVQNDLKDQSSMGMMRSTGSPISKEMDWDNFISQINFFDRTNLVELLDDLVGQNKYTYMPGTPCTYKSLTHLPYSTYSGFQISKELNGDYKITRATGTLTDSKTINVINVSKDDLRTFRDYVAQRGIYAGGAKWGLTL